jgi:hypothetical protein
MARQSVDHGVFYQRLQNQARHPNRRDIRRGGQNHGQPIGEAPLLQFQIQSDELQFVTELREVVLTGVQQPAQQIRELDHHGLSALWIPFDVAANRVQ